VFQGRFKTIVVQRESYLLELACYVVLNPVRANMCALLQLWPWSSYRATAQVYATSCYSLKEIGQAFGLHYATVSRLVRAVEIESEEG